MYLFNRFVAGICECVV